MTPWLARPSFASVLAACGSRTRRSRPSSAPRPRPGSRSSTPRGRTASNERLLAAALRACGAEETARIVTKGGMSRPAGAWVPDGRAKAIRADCEASLEALDGLPIDLYLIHAPDPRTPWRTSVRALARLAEEGLVRHVGLSNVNRRQLDEALELAPVAAVQVALSPFDDRALRGGVLERCDELGIALIAHSPLGGPKRAARIDAEETLGWLLGLSRVVVPIPGARRPETARSAARAAATAPAPTPFRPRRASAPRGDGEVVLVMGIPGAGKSRVAAELRGARLSPPEPRRARRLAARARRHARRGARVRRPPRRPRQHLSHARRPERRARCRRPARGSRALHLARYAARPGAGQPRRAAARAVRLAAAAGGAARAREAGAGGAAADLADACVPRARAAGRGRGLRRGRARLVRARAGKRCRRRLRRGRSGRRRSAGAPGCAAPRLRLDGGRHHPGRRRIDAAVIETAHCSHGGGPPTCWCRPPLPGLPLAFARRHGVDPARSVLVGSAPAHKTLATTLGARYVPVGR